RSPVTPHSSTAATAIPSTSGTSPACTASTSTANTRSASRCTGYSPDARSGGLRLDPRRELARDGMFARLRAKGDRPAEGSDRDELDLGPRGEPELAQVAQEVRVPVRHARNDRGLGRGELGERAVANGADAELAVGDRVAVRVVRRVAEVGVDLRLELLGQGVLEAVGLRLGLDDRETEAGWPVAHGQAVWARES